MTQRRLPGLWALITVMTAARLAVAAPVTAEVAHSAAYWRDMCAGKHAGISRVEQDRMCLLYLSSFQDAADEYRDAGHELFCVPAPISAETMRRDFLSYMADVSETAEFFPVGRALIQALMRAYPCEIGR